jgi:hypothetical protein
LGQKENKEGNKEGNKEQNKLSKFQVLVTPAKVWKERQGKIKTSLLPKPKLTFSEGRL